jgi:hypothetical protein
VTKRWLRWLEHPAGLVLVLIGLTAPTVAGLLSPVRNGDIAWHLAMGRWIARNGTVPDAEAFTYTAAGAPMVAHEWLTQWLYWLWASAFGLAGLQWLHVAFGVVTVTLAFQCFRRAGAAPTLALFGTGWFLLLVEPRFQVRPQMLNPVLGIALFTLIFGGRGTISRRTQVWTGGGIALWANLHSGAALLPALLWGFVTVDFVQRRWTHRPPWPNEFGGGEARGVVTLAGIASLACLLTPNHVRLLPYLFESGQINAGRSAEWLSVLRYFQEPDTAPLIAAWCASLIACLLTCVLTVREGRRWAPAAVALACALAPVVSIRFVWLSFAPIAFVLGELSRALARLGDPPRARVLAAIGSVTLAVALAWTLRAPAVQAGPFFAPPNFPIASARMLDEVPLDGRVFARSEWGGLITWLLDERVPIFADGRWITIGDRVIKDAHIIATGRPRSLFLLDQWDIDVVVVERGWLNRDRLRAKRNRAWVRVFAGYNSEIWVRRGERGAGNREAFRRYYEAHGIPLDFRTGFRTHQAMRANPEWARAHGVSDRFVAHFLPGGRRSERGYVSSVPSAGAAED